MRLISLSKQFFVLFFSLSISILAQSGIPAGAMMDAPPSEQPAEEPPLTSSTESQNVTKHAGPPSILISRPVYAPYSEEDNTMFIASMSEAYFNFKLSSLSGFQVIPQERLANSIQYYRDFSRRISRNAYLEAARNLGASYLFYQEYEPQGKKIRYNIEFYSINDNQRLVTKNLIIEIDNFESGLQECVNAVVSSLSPTISNSTKEFLTTPVFNSNSKTIESLGNSLASTGDYSQKKAAAIVSEIEKIVNSNNKMYVAKYVAAQVCASAKKYDKAIDYQNDLIAAFGSANPSLYLSLASYYKEAGSYNNALDAADKALKESSFRLLVLSERANIYEAKGDLKKAQDEYQKVLSEGGDDGAIFFKLALVSIGLNNLSASANYISKAQDAGYQLDRDNYFDLGLRYSALGNANDKAIEAFKNSLGIQQDKEEAWQQLAKLYTKMNRKEDAAECYVSLFQINNEAYKDDLLKAAEIYEDLNQTDKVKDIYALYLARKFVNPLVSVKLAKLEAQSGNCDKATDLVFGMDTISSVAADVRDINQKCGKPLRRVAIPTEDVNTRHKSPGVFLWRAISGVVTVAAAGAGYYLNTQIVDKGDKYHQSKNLIEIDKLRKDINSYKTYRNACYAGAAAGGVSLAMSITFPIIFSKSEVK